MVHSKAPKMPAILPRLLAEDHVLRAISTKTALACCLNGMLAAAGTIAGCKFNSGMFKALELAIVAMNKPKKPPNANPAENIEYD